MSLVKKCLKRIVLWMLMLFYGVVEIFTIIYTWVMTLLEEVWKHIFSKEARAARRTGLRDAGPVRGDSITFESVDEAGRVYYAVSTTTPAHSCGTPLRIGIIQDEQTFAVYYCPRCEQVLDPVDDDMRDDLQYLAELESPLDDDSGVVDGDDKNIIDFYEYLGEGRRPKKTRKPGPYAPKNTDNPDDDPDKPPDDAG